VHQIVNDIILADFLMRLLCDTF